LTLVLRIRLLRVDRRSAIDLKFRVEKFGQWQLPHIRHAVAKRKAE